MNVLVFRIPGEDKRLENLRMTEMTPDDDIRCSNLTTPIPVPNRLQSPHL